LGMPSVMVEMRRSQTESLISYAAAKESIARTR
jgi:hypothetical protein